MLLIQDLAQLVTHKGTAAAGGETQDQLTVLEGRSILIKGEKIAAIGTTETLLKRHPEAKRAPKIQGKKLIALPGLVDPHTHLPWMGNRRQEFNLRLRGVTYVDIAKKGGGILNTLQAVREATPKALTRATVDRALSCLQYGVTTVEAKSGYGLSLKDEIKQLEAIRDAQAEVPLRLVPTLLAAHELPPEYRTDRRAFIDLIVRSIIPEVSSRKLAAFCDVFCEKGFFSPEEAFRILQAAGRHGLKPRLHADEFVSSGAAEVAGHLRALSADPLNFPSAAGLRAMAKAGTVAVLLPGASMFLLHRHHPNVSDLRKHGIPMAIGTDANPGSSPTTNLLLVMRLGSFLYGMSAEAAITAVTLNAAASLNLAGETGTLETGKLADLSLWAVPHYLDLFYHYGDNPLAYTICRGKVAFQKR
jgi:imidazolonepropionase